METSCELLQSLRIGGFSLTFFMSILVSCDPPKEHIEEWSFHNLLENEVELYLHTSSNQLKNMALDYHTIASGDSVVLYTNVITNIGGVGSGFFYNLLDSVMVKFSDVGDTIAIWRNNKHHTNGEGFDGLYNFYDDRVWNNGKSLLQHSVNHVQYRYYLTLEEDFLPIYF